LEINLYFFSRDTRTHALFRKCWHLAAENLTLNVIVVNRNFGIRNGFISIINFFQSSRGQRVIFGTSEICLYSFFSKKNDIWVFTGLGRLLTNNNLIAIFIRWYLSLCYSGQLTIVLNEHDKIFIGDILRSSPILLNGEGYFFDGYNFSHYDKVAQDGITFAYVGRLLKSKGVDEVLNNFSKYSRADWKLLLIGDSDFGNVDAISQDDLNRYSDVSLGDIVFTGFRSDVRDILRSVDVLISLSQREGLPFSILDGINAGTYLALSAVPGHLSFSGLPGVTILESGCTGQFFDEIALDPDIFLQFNRVDRLNLCIKKFGHTNIVKDIERLLVSHP
jgi:glycosyltransferase involved in cell wall biosynthesis